MNKRIALLLVGLMVSSLLLSACSNGGGDDKDNPLIGKWAHTEPTQGVTVTVEFTKDKLGFTAKRTMALAQGLYEGQDVGNGGTTGLITYMRTDSTNIAETALREIAEVVRTEFGSEYTLAQPRRYKTRARGAQEAHEAIRPTSALRTPDRVSGTLDRNQQLGDQ